MKAKRPGPSPMSEVMDVISKALKGGSSRRGEELLEAALAAYALGGETALAKMESELSAACEGRGSLAAAALAAALDPEHGKRCDWCCYRYTMIHHVHRVGAREYSLKAIAAATAREARGR